MVKNRVASDDLPDLSPPEFSKSIRVRNTGTHSNSQKPTKEKPKNTKIKRAVNTKLLLDNSTNSSRSSSGSGGKFFFWSFWQTSVKVNFIGSYFDLENFLIGCIIKNLLQLHKLYWMNSSSSWCRSLYLFYSGQSSFNELKRYNAKVVSPHSVRSKSSSKMSSQTSSSRTSSTITPTQQSLDLDEVRSIQSETGTIRLIHFRMFAVYWRSFR